MGRRSKLLQKDSGKEFQSCITIYFPGNAEPVCYQNVREYTLGAEGRVHFILEDGHSYSTNLPFFMERKPAR